MKISTQRQYRYVIEKWVKDEKIGHRSVVGIRREHVKIMMGKRANRPGAASDFLKTLKVLVRYAIDNGWRTDNPTDGVKKFRIGEHHTWTDAEIALFETRWPVGSTERLAFALLLYTGQRLSDVVRMSWGDIDSGAIQITQQKTGSRMWIPVHSNLRRILEKTAKNHVTILTTSFQKSFSAAGFGIWMAEKINASKLPDRCVTHGIRKAAARRLAEAGCSANEIASITGHKSLVEVERYTRAADQRRLAKAAVIKIPERD